MEREVHIWRRTTENGVHYVIRFLDLDGRLVYQDSATRWALETTVWEAICVWLAGGDLPPWVTR